MFNRSQSVALFLLLFIYLSIYLNASNKIAKYAKIYDKKNSFSDHSVLAVDFLITGIFCYSS